MVVVSETASFDWCCLHASIVSWTRSTPGYQDIFYTWIYPMSGMEAMLQSLDGKPGGPMLLESLIGTAMSYCQCACAQKCQSAS